MSRPEKSEYGRSIAEYQKETGKPRQGLIRQSDAGKTGRGSEHAAPEPPAEQDPFYPVFWERFIEKASVSPAGEDPAFWPLRMFADFEHITAERESLPNPGRRELGEKLAPIQESIRCVRTAYEILAYPQCRNEDFQECIEGQLEADRQLHGRDQVVLTDAELEIVGKLCTTPRQAIQRGGVAPQPEIPFDPHKRVYSYAEVPVSPYIDPYGRHHMSTEEIRRGLSPKPQLPKK